MADREPRVVTPPPPDPEPDEKPRKPPKNQKSTSAPGPGSGRPSGRANRTSVERIENALNDGLAGIALALQFQGNDVAAVIVSERGPKVASAWAELARQNSNVRKTLERLLQGTAWSGVAVSTAAMVMPLMQVYGAYPANVPNPFGLTPAEIAKVELIRRARAEHQTGMPTGPNGVSG